MPWYEVREELSSLYLYKCKWASYFSILKGRHFSSSLVRESSVSEQWKDVYCIISSSTYHSPRGLKNLKIDHEAGPVHIVGLGLCINWLYFLTNERLFILFYSSKSTNLYLMTNKMKFSPYEDSSKTIVHFNLQQHFLHSTNQY